MKPFNYLKQIFAMTFLSFSLMLVGCTKETINESNPDDANEDTPINYAPDGIIGNTLTAYLTNGKTLLNTSGFRSNGTCSAKMISGFILTNTPKFTYTVTTGEENKATFKLQYSCKAVGIDNSTVNESFTLNLTFTSETGGIYTGNEGSRVVSGKFILN